MPPLRGVVGSPDISKEEFAMIGSVARRRSMVMIGLSALTLAACAPEANNLTPGRFSGGDGTIFAQAGEPPGQADQATALARLAISHSFALRMPSIEVEAVQRRHLAECAKLACTVLNTRLDRSVEGRVTARSSVRIPPGAYAGFAAIIATPPAEIISHSESAEDKTVALIDLERRLDAKSALRDRLTAMLRDPNTKTPSDLVAIEKELAQVQGDIEAATAQRDYLRTITDTVRVDIIYNGQAVPVGGIDFLPIEQAIRGAGRTLVESVASLIWVLVAVAPWLPLFAILVWDVRRRLRRWRAQKANA